MRPELRNEMLRTLEDLSKGKPLVLHFGDDGLIFEAVDLLTEYGALARIHRRTPMDGVRTAEGGG